MILNLLLSVLWGALLAAASLSHAHAAPIVTSHSGVLSDGRSIQLAGSGFGSKAQAAPLKFDKFENGTNGLSLSSRDPAWKNYGTIGVDYSNTTSHSGSLSVGTHIANGESFHTNYFTTSPAVDEIFISYWWRTANAGAGDNTIVKMTRISSSAAAGGGGVYGGPGNMTVGGTFNISISSGPYCAYNNGETSETFYQDREDEVARLAFPPLNQWLRVDMYKKLSTPGQANGKAFIRLFGTDLSAPGAPLLFRFYNTFKTTSGKPSY